ncbi:hypothetical protein [Natrialbaceae archaeon AArc-T1-2]|nr:hypothetical protein [Natrialbaceae archaeon AArc-T1-2]WIV68443.1 hypothetical protein QQ977_06895 [Natrialbaceae archaeon AArc-T1-2]
MTAEFVPASDLYDVSSGHRTTYRVAVMRGLAHTHSDTRGESA